MELGTIFVIAICGPLAFYIARQAYLTHKYFGGHGHNGRITCKICGQQYDLYSHGWYSSSSWHEPMKTMTSPHCGCYKQVTMRDEAVKQLEEAKLKYPKN